MFVTDEKVNEVAEELLYQFEVGELHSRCSTGTVARAAMEVLADNGLPLRQSLAFVIAKKAQAAWIEQVHQTAKQIQAALN